MGDLSRWFNLSEFAQRNPTVAVPSLLFTNVKRLARNLDVLREETGPVIISSGYRTQAKNTAVGGAANSQHLTAGAADFTVRDVSAEEVYCTVLRLIGEGHMEEGGLGFYGPGGHIHYDVRGSRARWNEAPLPACSQMEDDDMALADDLAQLRADHNMLTKAFVDFVAQYKRDQKILRGWLIGIMEHDGVDGDKLADMQRINAALDARLDAIAEAAQG